MSRLPDKPSALIRVALDDLAACELSKDYEVNMGEWHILRDTSLGNPYCAVCFAGAVMAQTLGADLEEDLNPASFPRDTNKLQALDCFRQGEVVGGLVNMGLAVPRGFGAVAEIPAYDAEDPTEFHWAMCDLADRLEKAGL